MTETACTLLEEVRLIIEVLLGVQIRFRNMHLGKVRGNDKFTYGRGSFFGKSGLVQHVEFDKNTRHSDPSKFSLKIGDVWYDAQLTEPYLVRIIPSKLHANPRWKVGISFMETWEEPLFPAPKT